MKCPSSLLFLATATAWAAPTEAIQRVTLDERAVISVPVATNRVTTLSFPGPITGIDAAGVSADPKVPALFQLAHTKGSSFLSVRAAVVKAAANLNIRWNKRTYVFELMQSDAPVLALHLEDRAETVSFQSAPPLVTPSRLLALLDKAKAFPILKQQHPASLADVAARAFGNTPQVTDYLDYEIRIEEVFRFNAEDTLIFHVTLRNKSDQEIRYRPDSFAVRVGTRLYPQSISDAPGVLPPKSSATVYFAVTGTPDGGRNEISLKNEFTIHVTRTTPQPPLPSNHQESLPAIPQEDCL